jgi:hypothetical protein
LRVPGVFDEETTESVFALGRVRDGKKQNMLSAFNLEIPRNGRKEIFSLLIKMKNNVFWRHSSCSRGRIKETVLGKVSTWQSIIRDMSCKLLS